MQSVTHERDKLIEKTFSHLPDLKGRGSRFNACSNQNAVFLPGHAVLSMQAI